MTTKPLIIFHTNDIHARLDAMSKLSHFAKRLRAEAESDDIETLFWDAGDAADRRTEICSLTMGASFPDLLNVMGVSVQTVGNALGLTYGPQVLEAYARRAGFPLLAANMRDGPEGDLVAGVQESVIVQVLDGVPLGIFGLTSPWEGAYKIFGLDMPDPVLIAKRIVAELDYSGCRIIILLSHMGLPDDRLIAEGVPGIDLIIGAHTHDLLPSGDWVGDTLIAQAGDYAAHLGQVRLEISGDTGRIVSKSAEVLKVPEDEARDPLFKETLTLLEEEVSELKASKIGDLPGPLEISHQQESPMGNFAADALRRYMGADAAILMSGLIRDGLKSGEVTIGDLNRVCFTTANPYRSSVTGATFKMALERSLHLETINSYLASFRGTPVGFPQVSGVSIDYNPDEPQGSKIKCLRISGKEIDLDRTYTIAHTDAETMQSISYLDPELLLDSQAEVPTILPTVLKEHLQYGGAYEETLIQRWFKKED